MSVSQSAMSFSDDLTIEVFTLSLGVSVHMVVIITFDKFI